jgi:hypothetical protein
MRGVKSRVPGRGRPVQSADGYLGHILFIIQGAWVAIYSFMFTIVGALPFGFYFLGPKDDSE